MELKRLTPEARLRSWQGMCDPKKHGAQSKNN
jgi:hypothetical protein